MSQSRRQSSSSSMEDLKIRMESLETLGRVLEGEKPEKREIVKGEIVKDLMADNIKLKDVLVSSKYGLIALDYLKSKGLWNNKVIYVYDPAKCSFLRRFMVNECNIGKPKLLPYESSENANSNSLAKLLQEKVESETKIETLLQEKLEAERKCSALRQLNENLVRQLRETGRLMDGMLDEIGIGNATMEKLKKKNQVLDETLIAQRNALLSRQSSESGHHNQLKGDAESVTE